jgi:hypothetical protein
MKNITQTLIRYTIWAFIFAATSYVYATGTFTEPSGGFGGFPNNNTDAPINVGPVAQTKLGPLTTTGFTSLSYGHIGTNLSVGSPVVNPAPLGLVGLFTGNVGAAKYCNSSGTECSSTFAGQSVYLATSQGIGIGLSYLSCSNTCVRAGASVNLITFKSSNSTAQKESRRIKGLIINYYQIFEGNSSLEGVRYNMTLDPESGGGEGISVPVIYDQSGTYSSAVVRNSNVIVWDGNNDNVIDIQCSVRKYNNTALNSSAKLLCGASIIGYITE